MSNGKFGFDLNEYTTEIHAPYIEANMTEAIKVTQSEFISTLFGDAKTRGVSRNAKVSAGWHRKELSMDSEPYPISMDNYFSVGAFAGEGSGKDDSKRMMVVVADDYPLERLSVEPTYILQTSESKPQPDGSLGASYQVGFAITDGDNLKIADRLMQALYLQGHADKSGNNRVRLARLPQSTNNKHDKPFRTRITRWNPERRFSLMDVARALGVDLTAQPEPIEGIEESSSEKLDISACVDSILDGLELHENINRLAMSYIGQGMRRDSVIANLQALMQRVEVKDARWQERYEDITRSVDTAIEKRNKEAEAINSTWEEYVYDLTVMKDEDYVFDGFLGEGIISAAGAAGVGKTNLLVTASARVTGFIGSDGDILVPRLKRKVIYITEHAAQVERILGGLARHVDKRVGSAEFKDWFTVFNAEQLPPEIITARIEDLIPEKTVTQVVPVGEVQAKPLIVFDTVAANFDIANENDNSEVGRCVNALRTVALRFKCPIITSGHTSKANKRSDFKDLSARGASSFEANSTVTSYIFGDEAGDPNTRFWKLGKHRYQPDFDEVCFRAVHHSIETVDHCGYTRLMFYFHLEVEQSSEALRASARIQKEVSGMQDPIVEFIAGRWAALQDGEEGATPPTKTTIRGEFGKSNATDQAIRSLVERGLLLRVTKGDPLWDELIKHRVTNNNIKEVYLLPERGAYDYK